MADVTVKVLDKGPLLVQGQIELVDSAGNRFPTKEQMGLCRCGLSKNKPFCDGGHGPGGFGDCSRAPKTL